jgi:hypothetical protein
VPEVSASYREPQKKPSYPPNPNPNPNSKAFSILVIMPVHLRPATEADLPAIVDVSTAAFPPNVDAIVRRLFPGDLHYSEGVRKARLARKGVTFGLKSTVMILAVEDDKTIVGYSIWEVPVPDAEEEEEKDKEKEEEEKPKPPPMAQQGVDIAALAELRRVLTEDVRESFGERGATDVWSEFIY